MQRRATERQPKTRDLVKRRVLLLSSQIQLRHKGFYFKRVNDNFEIFHWTLCLFFPFDVEREGRDLACCIPDSQGNLASGFFFSCLKACSNLQKTWSIDLCSFLSENQTFIMKKAKCTSSMSRQCLYLSAVFLIAPFDNLLGLYCKHWCWCGMCSCHVKCESALCKKAQKASSDVGCRHAERTKN